MPEIGRIQSTNFQSLLTELGITRNNIPFALRSEVTPVVLVGGTVSFIAAPTPAYRVPDFFSAGPTLNPAASTVLADTGALPIGLYSLLLNLQHDEAHPIAGEWTFQWRDAPNTTGLATFRISTIGPALSQAIFRLQIENDNERFRVLNRLLPTAGVTMEATILART